MSWAWRVCPASDRREFAAGWVRGDAERAEPEWFQADWAADAIDAEEEREVERHSAETFEGWPGHRGGSDREPSKRSGPRPPPPGRVAALCEVAQPLRLGVRVIFADS